MLDKYAQLFVVAAICLDEIKWIVMVSHENNKPNMDDRHKFLAGTLDAAMKTRRACIMADLDSVLPEIDRLEDTAKLATFNEEMSLMPLATALKHLVSRINDELSNEYFFHVDRRDVPMYCKKEIFGLNVSLKFSTSISDIESAGSCLALHQPTACVFHLMRVMEEGVRKLGSKLKISIDPKIETWNKILDHVDNAINGSKKRNTPGMPSKTLSQQKKKANYAQAYSYLANVRLAWRNEVMHPKASYTREEAHDIFRASAAFMNHLAGLV